VRSVRSLIRLRRSRRCFRLCQEGTTIRCGDVDSGGPAAPVRREAVPKGRRIDTALENALETGQYALAHLLLCTVTIWTGSPVAPSTSPCRGGAGISSTCSGCGVPIRGSRSLQSVRHLQLAPVRAVLRGRADLTSGHELADTRPPHLEPAPVRLCETPPRDRPPHPAGVEHRPRPACRDGEPREVHLCLWAGGDPMPPPPTPTRPTSSILIQTRRRGRSTSSAGPPSSGLCSSTRRGVLPVSSPTRPGTTSTSSTSRPRRRHRGPPCEDQPPDHRRRDPPVPVPVPRCALSLPGPLPR